VVRFTIFIYRFFRRRRKLFYAVLLSTAVFFAWFGLKINFEEDVSKLLPAAEKGGAEQLVFSNLKVKEKIFILFHSRSDAVETEALTETCDAFVEQLLAKDTVHHLINNILHQIDEDLFQDGITFLYEHLPVFLDGSQYGELDSLLEKEQVERQMEENYSMLLSPAGTTFKDMIVQDPVALRKLFISGMGNISNGLGGNYAFFNRHVVTADSSVVVAFLSPNFKSFDSKQNIRLAAMIEEEIDRFERLHPETEILYHGLPVRGVYNSKRIKADLLLTISISLALICMLLIGCFKNKSTLLYLVLPVIYGVLFSMTVIWFVKGSMSLMAVGIGAIVMGVAFSYCLHVITHHKYVHDPEKILIDQTVPVILGALTTIGAFLSLMLTESELLRDFGLFASLGLAGTTAFCLLFLPQLFHLQNSRKSKTAFMLLEKINSFPFERQKWLIAGIIVISAVCYIFSGRVRFDSDLRNIGYHEEKIVRSEELLSLKTSDELSTVYFAGVSDCLDTALIAAERLCRKMDTLAAHGRIKGYSAVFSLFVTQKEQQRRIDRWNDYWTDERKAGIRRKVMDAALRYGFTAHTFDPFFDMLDAEYEPVSLYDAGVIPEEIADNIIEYTDGRYLVFIPVRMDRTRLDETGDCLVKGDPNAVVIDPMYYTGNMVKVIHDDFNIILGISSLFVMIVLLISFKSIVLAVLAFLPMGLSWYIVLGTMAIFGIEFNLINIIVSSFIFGIGVDYSIFIMDGLLAKYRTGEQLLVYHKTAILFSAAILVIVVISLLFAVHPAIASIGMSTLTGMVATILIAYSLQPFLFSLLISGRAEKGKAPVALAFLLRRKGQPAPQQTLKDNYRYKGYAIERRLHAEMKRTGNFSALSEAIDGQQSMLEYGCGYGFCSCWVALTNKRINVTGFDANPEAIALADHCYLKTDKLRFTSDPSVLEAAYDVVVIRKPAGDDEAIIKKLSDKAKTVIKLF
jgi:predicted exporter